MGNRVGEIETNVTAVENRIDKDLDTLEKSLDNRVGEIETNVTAVENRIDKLDALEKSLDNRMGGIEANFTAVESKVDGIWTDIKARFDSSKCKESCGTSS